MCADFYINGGTSQPGCGSSTIFETLACDHTKVTPYFIESIVTQDGFYAGPCTNLLSYLFGWCQPKEKELVLMGENCSWKWVELNLIFDLICVLNFKLIFFAELEVFIMSPRMPRRHLLVAIPSELNCFWCTEINQRIFLSLNPRNLIAVEVDLRATVDEGRQITTAWESKMNECI